jgi:hypothetical protein
MQQFLCSLNGTFIPTPHAFKFGSWCGNRGWRIGLFQHQSILSPVVAVRECLRPFHLKPQSSPGLRLLAAKQNIALRQAELEPIDARIACVTLRAHPVTGGRREEP